MTSHVNYLWEEAVGDILRDGHYLKSRAGGCKEIIGWQGSLYTGHGNNILSHSERKFSGSYACAEFLWYLSLSNIITMIKAYAPSYVNFSDDGRTANGAYGYRWRHNTGFDCMNMLMETKFRSQLDAVAQILQQDPNSRQAVMSMWDSRDVVNSSVNYSKDTPCSLTHTFFVRRGALHMVSNMRSNDVWLGMPYDIFCNVNLQIVVAQMIGANLGPYTHQVGSLHLYDKHIDKAVNAIGRKQTVSHFGGYKATGDIRHDIAAALELEKEIRATGTIPKAIDELLKGSLMRDIVLGCASKWTGEAVGLIYNHNLKAVV